MSPMPCARPSAPELPTSSGCSPATWSWKACSDPPARVTSSSGPSTTATSQLILIALNSPTGQAVLECDRAHIEHFVRRTFDIVAVGEEGTTIDIDRCINLILGEGLKEV